MYGLSVKFPLVRDEEDGYYSLNKDYVELAVQNLKNLLLTEPGERIMDPEFGVGIRSLLFEQDSAIVRSSLNNRIEQQITRYMPFLELIDLNVGSEGHSFSVSVKVEIIPIGQQIIVPLDIREFS